VHLLDPEILIPRYRYHGEIELADAREPGAGVFVQWVERRETVERDVETECCDVARVSRYDA
jgi:hypothetical protein